jgi:Spy/CpxP family protein refolding chaperone
VRESATIFSLVLIFLVSLATMLAGETNASTEAEAKAADYTRTINQRADKIVSALNIADTNKAVRVRDIIAQQYRDLNVIHAERDAQTKSAKEKAGTDKIAANTGVETARAAAKPKLDKLHGEFLAKLSAELLPEQVDKVKDGLTYGVAPLTYGVYLKMYPELTVEQKAQIKAWLNEARELAMDGSTSDEKHALFGKYKGKINNYLSKAGYDAKKAEQNLKKPAAPPSESKSK